jgi:hypothetical protein
MGDCDPWLIERCLGGIPKPKDPVCATTMECRNMSPQLSRSHVVIVVVIKHVFG